MRNSNSNLIINPLLYRRRVFLNTKLMRILNVSVNISNLPSKEDLINIIKSDDRNKKVTVSEINKAIKESGLYKANTKSESGKESDPADDRNDNTI